MKKLLNFLVLIILIFDFVSINAQSNLEPCGTTEQYLPKPADFLQHSNHTAARSDEVLFIPLQIHIVGTDNGGGYYSFKTLLKSLCSLNEDFIDADIQFFLTDEINYISNSTYYNHEFNDGYDMMNEYNVNNAINCYIVSSPAGNCGYFAPGADGVALAKSCMQPGESTWAHELGHFLSLDHTFYGWEYDNDDPDFTQSAPNSVAGRPVERVNGSNCHNASDGFCDSPADYLAFRWSCNSEGFSNITQIDPNGVEFVSDGSLFMSYANDACQNRFSDEQIDAMRANIEFQRTYLLTTPPDEESVMIETPTNLNVLSPTQNDVIEGNSVHLEWEAIPNATHYIVQVNPFNIFSIIFNEFIVDSPSLDFTNLLPNETFFWRVRAYNPYFTCSDFTQPSSFNTGNVTSVFELEEGENLRLFPNPTQNGYIWMEISSLSAKNAIWTISDINGRLVQKRAENMLAAVKKILIDTSDLANGIYIVNLQLGDRQVHRKIIVN